MRKPFAFHRPAFWLAAGLPLALNAFGCTEDEAANPLGKGSTASAAASSSGAGGTGGGGEIGPGPAFDPWCAGKDWQSTLQPETLGKLYGGYVGVLDSSQLPSDAIEGQKFIPDHPFQVTKIRAAFAGMSGPVRLRLTRTFGRTFPSPWPEIADTSQDLMPPIDINVDAPDPDTFVEIDVASPNVFLLPSQHYNLIYEHLAPEPMLALEGVKAAEREPERDYSRAGIFLPAEKDGGGIGGTSDVPSLNYRVELEGNSFCQLEEPARWFGETAAPFADEPSPYLTVGDFDADGHDDLVVYVPPDGAITYRGDGHGGFTKVDGTFSAAPSATLIVFGDVDNDGDRDAFAGTWVAVDQDADLVDVMTEHDCNNTLASVHPGAAEIAGNGRDDDCDGVADDGTDTSDADGDGVTIAAGDCDDTDPAMFPGNPEVLDAKDNDCNLECDETFVDKLLLNDGAGHFTAVAASGVEAIDPSTSGAFGDGNADGILDLYWGNWLEVYPNDKSVQDCYFTGNGDGTFTDAQGAAGLVLPKAYSAFGVLWNDYDNDGDQDILVDNYHLYPNQLWQNQGDGTFLDVGVETGIAYDDIPGPPQYKGGHTFGADFGDIDNDGDMDFYLANLAHPRFAPWSDPSQFLLNTGDSSFDFTANQLTAWGFEYDEGDANVAFADFDNDGDLDLAIASLYEAHYSRLYRNDGAGHFVDITYETGIAVRDAVSLTVSDVDEDGDVDLLIADRGGAPYVHLFTNRVGQDKGWVELDLVGTQSARDAVGARVTLKTGSTSQMRDVRDGGGHGGAQQTHWVHFGVGDARAIDEVTVRWLGGETETITGIEPRGRYRITQGSGAAVKL